MCTLQGVDAPFCGSLGKSNPPRREKNEKRYYMSIVKKLLLGTAIVVSYGVQANAQQFPGLPDQTAPTFGSPGDFEEQRYIIKYKDGARDFSASRVADDNGRIELELGNRNLIAASMTRGAAMALKENPNIETIELDPRRYLMAEDVPYGIPMVQADQLSDAATGNQKVCIMDTGYDRQHVDLQAIRVDGNDGHGSNNTGNWYQDGHGHGTHVAGTIAAIGGNNEGVVGVNPGDNLNLHIVKVFNNNGNWAYGSDLIAAIDQCVDAGSNVISMSLGGGGSSTAEQQAFENAASQNILSIAAAGNDGNSSLSYPASYDIVMSVGAVNSSGTIAGFSQFNSQVEISAPGVGVNSTLPNNQYAAWSGTSMATPHVSGVAALVWSHYPDCSAAEIRDALNATAEDRGATGRDNYYGHGIVKAKAAFDSLATGCDGSGNPPPPPPVEDGVLENGVTATGISGARFDEVNFTMEVPPGATDLQFVSTAANGGGDVDMYVKAGEAPTLTTYDCRPFKLGSEETCSFPSPDATTYHVMLRGFTSFSNISLTGTYTDVPPPPPSEPPVANFSYDCAGLTCDFDGGGSVDDGTIVKYGWNNGDVSRRSMAGPFVTHTYSAEGTYRVILSVTDDQGLRDVQREYIDVSDGVANIDVWTLKRKRTDFYVGHVRWSGASGDRVDVHKNGSFYKDTKNDGTWWERHDPVPGTYNYRICETGSTTACSEEVSIVFD